jgi:hypothetical protein
MIIHSGMLRNFVFRISYFVNFVFLAHFVFRVSYFATKHEIYTPKNGKNFQRIIKNFGIKITRISKIYYQNNQILLLTVIFWTNFRLRQPFFGQISACGCQLRSIRFIISLKITGSKKCESRQGDSRQDFEKIYLKMKKIGQISPCGSQFLDKFPPAAANFLTNFRLRLPFLTKFKLKKC